ncbi:glycosyltransferase [Candidatus Igneacidithiobacillus taiwanensis]|uniref:glycosyltransferase n=1 Tax=Candidatus Igneacidithiobacillus taiwanensis TaxID=1945924 RepID=UPI00289F97AA|nr:glycosyltransferase [Candidatus Igneacidithiobacillus taiwanensis]
MNSNLIIFCVADKFFLTHFLERATHARCAGYEIVVVAPDTGFADKIIKTGFGFIPIDLERHNINPIPELRSIFQLAGIYRENRPDLVWQIGIKPIVLGTLAVLLGSPGTKIVNAPVGLGYVFAGEDRKARLIRPLLKKALRHLLNPRGSVVIFENTEDLRELQQIGALRGGGIVIKGTGVNLEQFPQRDEPREDPITILLAARMIEEKGIRVFIEASRILRTRGRFYRFVLAGGVDAQHSAAIPEHDLQEWSRQGIVEWLGDRHDMSAVIGQCNIFCLPTWHREGIPKVLLEAMATGRAIITTNVVGCRELVQHNKNGWLIPPRDAIALADAIERLAQDSALRRKLGMAARRDAEREYASEQVCRRTLRVFKSLVPLPHAIKTRRIAPHANPDGRAGRQEDKRAILCVVPSYNGCDDLKRLLSSLEIQDIEHDVFVIDSSSIDGSREMIKESFPRVRLHVIPKSDFGHAKTRQMAFRQNPGYKFYVYLTQDAYFYAKDSLKLLLKRFEDGRVGAVCGRQVPHPNASIFATFSRFFNYPEINQLRCLKDRERFGIKTAFLSNSCSAYRAEALRDAGGFPEDVKVSEDLYVGAKMLLAGWCIAYSEIPICYHSHNYSIKQEFKRYRDIGAFHGSQKWIAREFGGAGGEGLRYAIGELRFLGWQRIWLWPISMVRNMIKYIGYQIGYHNLIV